MQINCKNALTLAVLTLFLMSNAVIADGLKFVRKNFEAGHYAETIIAYERLDEDLKRQSDARFIYATALSKEGRIESATLIFEQLVKDNPQTPEYFNNLAVLYSKQNRFDDAQKALENGLATHKSYQTITENLHRLFQEQSRLSYAKALNVDNQPIKLAMINQIEKKTLPVVTLKPTVVDVPNNTVTQIGDAAPISTPSTMPMIVAADKPQAPKAIISSIKAKNPIDTIISRLHEWADYWQNRDLNNYFASYDDNFKSIRWPERSVWKSERTRRILKPKEIHIAIDNIEVNELSGEGYRVDFDMVYRSDFYQDKTRKRIDFVQKSGKWLILREVSLKAY